MRWRLPLCAHSLPIFPILNPLPFAPRRFSFATLSKDDDLSLYCQMWIDNFRHPDHFVINLSTFLRYFDLWVLTYQKVATTTSAPPSRPPPSGTSSPSADGQEEKVQNQRGIIIIRGSHRATFRRRGSCILRFWFMHLGSGRRVIPIRNWGRTHCEVRGWAFERGGSGFKDSSRVWIWVSWDQRDLLV